LPDKINLRPKAEVTSEEIEILKERFKHEFLPSGFYHTGRFYVNSNGETLVEHPNFEKCISVFIDEENAKIGEKNREI
jgi:hypothetical protein